MCVEVPLAVRSNRSFFSGGKSVIVKLSWAGEHQRVVRTRKKENFQSLIISNYLSDLIQLCDLRYDNLN